MAKLLHAIYKYVGGFPVKKSMKIRTASIKVPFYKPSGQLHFESTVVQKRLSMGRLEGKNTLELFGTLYFMKMVTGRINYA